MSETQYCSECVHFESVTHEEWSEYTGEYHMWTDISCEMGHMIDDTLIGHMPFDRPCEDYEEEQV